jgi:Uso1 / p115 like vesicle tethering protein, head region
MRCSRGRRCACTRTAIDVTALLLLHRASRLLPAASSALMQHPPLLLSRRVLSWVRTSAASLCCKYEARALHQAHSITHATAEDAVRDSNRARSTYTAARRAQGVERLMDLLAGAEAIRNEALLLLVRLTAGHEEIQKAVAYKDAFDALFAIVSDEGYAAGGVLVQVCARVPRRSPLRTVHVIFAHRSCHLDSATCMTSAHLQLRMLAPERPSAWTRVPCGLIVQDCLLLLINLLRDNPANQLMFRETGHLGNVPNLLRVPDAASAPAGTGLRAAASGIEARLEGPAGPGGGGGLSPDVAATLRAAMELVTALLSPLSPATMDPASHGGAEALRGKVEMAKMCLEANHALLAKTQLRVSLLELALLQGQGAACDARCQALQTLGVAVAGRQAVQDALGNTKVSVRGTSTPAIQALLHRLLLTTSEAEAAAACQLFEALCHGNPDGQVALSAMLPLANPKPLSAAQPFGEMLLAGVMADTGSAALPGTATCCHACCVLACLASGNAHVRTRVLAIQVDVRSGRLAAPKQYELMGLLMHQLSRAWGASQAKRFATARSGSGLASGPPSNSTPRGGAADGDAVTPRTEAPRHGAAGWAVPALLCLAIALTYGCAEAVTSLLKDASHVPLLLELLQTQSGLDDALIRGLAAALLGCCVVASATGDAASGAAGVVDVLSNRVGIRGYFAALEGLLDAVEMQVRGHASISLRVFVDKCQFAVLRAKLGRCQVCLQG